MLKRNYYKMIRKQRKQIVILLGAKSLNYCFLLNRIEFDAFRSY